MSFVSELLVNLMYTGLFIYVGQECFGYARRYCKYEKLVYLLAVLITTIVIYSNDIFVKLIAFLGCLFIVMATFFRERIIVIISFFLGFSFALAQLSELIDVLWLGLIRMLKISLTDPINSVWTMVLEVALIYVVGQFYKKKYPNQLRKISTGYWIFFVLMLLFDSVVVLSLGDFIENELDANRKYIYEFSYLFVVIGILVQLVLLINTIVTRNVHKENELQAKQFLENQKDHYLHLERRELETKKFRHDIRNHLTLLNHLIYEKQYDEVEKYLDALNEKVESFGNQISVNNGIADAVLNKFYYDAKEQGIELVVNGHFPMTCYVSAYDICTILSNLLSNAFMAQQLCDRRCVSVDVRYSEEDIYIIVENDYVHELKAVDGVFETTKENPIGHGLGLSNVKQCVDQCGGLMSISAENHHFKVMISLKNVKRE